VRPADGARRQITPHYALVNTRSPLFLRASLADGWHDEESDPKTGERWRWTKGDATLHVDNPQQRPAHDRLRARRLEHRRRARADAGGDRWGDDGASKGRRATDDDPVAEVTVPPGGSTITLHSLQPPASAGPGDPRVLGVCVFGIELEVRPQ